MIRSTDDYIDLMRSTDDEIDQLDQVMMMTRSTDD